MSARIAVAPLLPGLIVAERAQAMTKAPDPEDPGVEACYDSGGDLLAYCRAEDGHLHVDLLDVASFSYDSGARHVSAVAHRELSPAFILDTYHHCVLPLMLPALGTEVLHASAVLCEAGVAVLCGQSGTGKSTTAAALARRGYATWADDAVAVDMNEPGPRLIPRPFAARLCADAARFVNAAGAGEPSATATSIDLRPEPLALLCVLRRSSDMPTSVAIERLPASAACREALAHAHCFSVRDPVWKRRTVETYLALSARVPAYEVQFRPGLDHLPALLDALQGLVGPAVARPT